MDTSFLRLFQDRKIIICVDDYGLTPGINQAVVNLAKSGKINATSVLVDAPNLTQDYIEEAYMLKNKEKLELGLHLNFTELLSDDQDEDLVAPINSQLIKSKFFSKATVEKVYEEISRQFYLFESLFDCWPDFIDGHQHVHMLPGFFEALRKFYTENRLDQEKIWIRSLNRVRELNKTILPGSSSFKNLILRLATKKARSIVYSQRKELLGVYDFQVDEKAYKDLFETWKVKAQDYVNRTGRGAVIMCHPGVESKDIPEEDRAQAKKYIDPIRLARIREYKVLSEITH